MSRASPHDWALRQIIEGCQDRLADHGFALTHRGRVLNMQLVGFRRPSEEPLPPAEQASVVVGHDPWGEVLVAYLFAPGQHRTRYWRAPYEGASQRLRRSQEAIQLVDQWLAVASSSV